MSNKLSLNTVMEKDEATAYLDNLISGLRKGTVSVQVGESHVLLEPTGEVSFGIEAVQKEDKGWIEIRLSWKRPEEEPERPQLRISDKAPVEIEPRAEADPAAAQA